MKPGYYTRQDFTELLDGQWWNADFGETDRPGISYRGGLGSVNRLVEGKLSTIRSNMIHKHGKKLQTRRVSALTDNPYEVRVWVRAVDRTTPVTRLDRVLAELKASGDTRVPEQGSEPPAAI